MGHLPAQPLHCGGAHRLAGFLVAAQIVTLPGGGGWQERGTGPAAGSGCPLFVHGGTGASLSWPQEPRQGSAESQLPGRSFCLRRLLLVL